MDLSVFGTQITSSKGPLSGSSSALFSNGGLGGVGGGLGNLNFLEAILGNLDTDGEIKTKADNQNTQTDIPTECLKKEAVDLTLLQLALLGQDPDKTLDEKLADLKIEKLLQTEENRIAQLTKLIDHLTSGLPQDFSAQTSIEELVTRLNKRLENLESSLAAFRTGDFSDDEAPFKLLIATGLNPAQLTKITERIEEVETKLGRELTVEDLIAGVGNIIPAPGEKDHEFSTTDALGLLLAKNNQASKNDNNAAIAAEDLKTEKQDTLNELAIAESLDGADNQNLIAPTLNVGTDNDILHKTPDHKGATIHYNTNDIQALLNLVAHSKIAPAGTQTNVLESTNGDTTVLPEEAMVAKPQAMSNEEFRALFGANNPTNAIGIKTNAVAQLNIANISPDATLPKVPMLGDMILPTNWSESSLSQQALNNALGFDVQTGAPFTQAMTATHTATIAQNAAQPHPGTAMVAAQITKAAQGGETRNMTLQLNPPELGRVEVRMEFASDNKIKAHMVVEKLETYLMLQRDMAALDRALQDAGFDTGSDSLNYQMAEDNYGFGSDKNSRDGNSGTNSAMNNAGETEEVIETTINWNVDSETGHVRYNILA